MCKEKKGVKNILWEEMKEKKQIWWQTLTHSEKLSIIVKSASKLVLISKYFKVIMHSKLLNRK